MTSPAPPSATAERAARDTARAVLFRRAWSLCTLLLLGSTWKLWTPQTVFPQVPLLSFAQRLPDWLEWVCLGLAVAGLVAALFDQPAGRLWKPALICCAVSFTGLFLTDQHRLQPWAYEAWLVALVLAACRVQRGLTLLRWLTISIYFYSAVSKLDHTFLETTGRQLCNQIYELLEKKIEGRGESYPSWFLPFGELALTLLLAIPFTRKAGFVGLLIMHGLLLLILGPLGFRQQPAVLIWNMQFMVLGYFLFWNRASRGSEVAVHSPGGEVEPEAPQLPAQRNWFSIVVHALLIFALAAPLLEPLGYWDHWLAWGLYSPGSSRVIVYVRGSDVKSLPALVQPFVTAAPEHDPNDFPWQQVRLDHWSLESLHVPIYPQARFQLGVALALARSLPPGQDLRAELYSAANRFTGQRELQTLIGRPQMEAAARQYWFNVEPRK